MNGAVLSRSKARRSCFVPAGDVEMIVEPAKYLGRIVDQVEVGLGVEMPKDLVGVLEHVQVLDFGGQSPDLESLLDRVRRPKVPRAGARGKNQDSSQHIETPQ